MLSNLYYSDSNKSMIKHMATKKKVEETVKSIGKEAEKVTENLENTYDALADRLSYEKDKLQREIKYEYRNARRYVRANPEQGIGIALLTGIALGILIGRASK